MLKNRQLAKNQFNDFLIVGKKNGLAKQQALREMLFKILTVHDLTS